MRPYTTDLLDNWDVVVVEDEEDSLFIAEYILGFHGATVHSARNGREGLALIRWIQPKFVISDLSMPVMDGWELINEMQRDMALREIPVIALTAHAMRGDRDRAIAAGFYNYLNKPLTADTFIQELVHLLIEIPEFRMELKMAS